MALNVYSSFAQEEKKIIEANQLTGSLQLDGRVDEEVWTAISSTGGFLMQEPVEGGEPTYKTEIRILYDESNLYIGVILHDDPAGIKAFQKKWDQEIETDDRFMWILDTFKDNRNAFYFEINPAGLHGDGLLSIGQLTTVNRDWDGIWRAWTHIGNFGWSAEIRIPFRSLSFNPKSEDWGINFQRTIRRMNEELLWTGHRRNQGLLRPQDAGNLTGLKGITQGLGLEAIPYGIVRRNQQGAGDEATEGYEVDAGFDINYSITPNLMASFSYNTDFAETEVDDRQINLTRFPLRFPEKRDFFLEGASIYQFAPASGVRPFFSRRIGLVSGAPIPISYGGRLLGRVGDFNIAALQVRTGEMDTVPPEDFTSVRIKKNVGKESSIGVIYTRRSTKNGESLSPQLQDRHTIGGDLELNTSNFLRNKVLQFQAFFVYHNTPFPNDDSTDLWDRSVRGVRLSFPNQPWRAWVSYREFGEFNDPAVGFTPRNGFRRVQPSFWYSPLIEKSDFLREISWGFRFEHLMDMQWEVLTQVFRFTVPRIRLESGDTFSFRITRDRERLQMDFDILRDGTVVIPQDEYIFWYTEFEIETATYRKVQLQLGLEAGEFWSGNREQFSSSITLRPLRGINLTGEYVHTHVNLPEGEFRTDLVRFNGNFDFTPFLSFNSNIQFDNVSDVLGINQRFRWIITPGTDLYLVYNHNWRSDPIENEMLTLSSQANFKVTYTHRF